MRLITDMAKEVSTKYSAPDMDEIKFFSNGCKELREMHVLCSIQGLLTAKKVDAPKFAIKTESPDFQTYSTDSGQVWSPIEIVEVLRPDYRRHASFKACAQETSSISRPIKEPLEDPWQELQKKIIDKSTQGYASTTALWIYYDMWIFDFKDWETLFGKQLLDKHLLSPFKNIDTFKQVLVMNSSMDELVRLHPIPIIIA